VALVEFTSHLKALFPNLGVGAYRSNAPTVAALIAELEAREPGFAFYVCDELGRLRQHVNVFVDEEVIFDRRALGDALGPESRVFIAQALSGG
jgi:hypothetical protein